MSHTRVTLAAPALVLVLAGCSGGGAESDSTGVQPTSYSPAPTEAEAAGDNRVYPGGQPLSEYEGLTSYPWRVAVVEQQDELLAAMQAVVPHLEVDNYGDLISTCDSADGGTDRATLITQGVTRFSGGPDEQVTEQQAATLVELALSRVCPSID